MSNVTPPTGAGDERLTVNMKLVVPASPSARETSLIERFTVTGPEHGAKVVEVLRGPGAAALKSVLLVSVSAQPPAARNSDVVLEGAGATAPSKKFAVPYPTRSMINASCAALHGVEPPLQPRVTVLLTSATFPAVALIAIGVASVVSGVGSAAPVAPPASWTR